MIWGCLAKCCKPVPQRFIVATMVLSGLAIQYINRLAFNLAITEITFKLPVEEKKFEGHTCEYNDTDSPDHGNLKAEFHWDSHDQANLVGAFYAGYIVTHLPGGILADEYGPKRILGYGALICAICTILTPICARTNIWILVTNRAIMGLAQGPVFPSLSTFVARWSIPQERNMMSAYMSLGTTVGAILGNLLTGYMLFHIDPWDTVFYFYGVITVVWYITWYFLSHDSASVHPFITDEERKKIQEGLKGEIAEGRKKIPYTKIFTSIPVWAMNIAGIGHDWAFYIIVTLLPQYMSYVLRLNVLDNGLINCLPYVAMLIVSLGSAKIAEIIVRKGWLTKTAQCKIWTFLCNMLPCACFLGASYAGCDRVLAVIMFVAAMGVMGMIYSSLRVVNVDMAPNFAGFLMSLMNGLGCLCGLFGPKVFAIFTETHTVESWRSGFYVSTVLITISSVIFVFFGSSKIQPWNFPRTSSQDVNEQNAAPRQKSEEIDTS